MLLIMTLLYFLLFTQIGRLLTYIHILSSEKSSDALCPIPLMIKYKDIKIHFPSPAPYFAPPTFVAEGSGHISKYKLITRYSGKMTFRPCSYILLHAHNLLLGPQGQLTLPTPALE